MLFWLNHILLPPHPLQFLIPSNLLIEFLLHLVDEIGAAVVLPPLDVRIGIVVAEHKKFTLTFIRHSVIH